MNEYRHLLERIRSIAREAGAAILEVYERDFGVETKADHSPLTDADRDANRIILRGLEGLSPRIPVVSEEAAAADHAQRLAWTRYWLVDPLDGTKEFIKRNGEFTVNIALVEDHAPVLGVVLAPALGREYFGGPAVGGAWRADPGAEPRPIHTSPTPQSPLRVVGSRSHGNGGTLERYLDALGGEHELRPMGSSLKICLVAEGEADIYPRFGPTSEWDTAAAQAVLEGAGGCMMDLSGQPLRYNRGESVLNPHFLAVGNLGRDWLAPIRSDSWMAAP
ncbi:MAG: 3'(2'),5'-bisphosphate nucleotidase CysQ [Gammaproteobacteria bacterium]|nr:3'(2'),5'-bisphosphate nucleotidase [Gammaproteobacteria bacterium]